MNKKFFLLLLSAVLAGILLTAGIHPEDERPLACLTLPTAEDTFMEQISRTFEETMQKNGFKTRIVSCDNSVITQLKQIQNFITSEAKLIAVNCAGNGQEYRDVFTEAQKSGIKVVALNASVTLDCCDVQSKEYSILKGIRQCELVKEYLDREYPDAAAGSVDVLLLEVSNKTNYVRMCAGLKLIQEKFLRLFDDASGSFIKEETNTPVYYLDEQGIEHLVDEPWGGLLLNEQGYAQLNSYYDERVCLHMIADKNIGTNLDAQYAIDNFMVTPFGSDLRIVMCFSGDAARGAGERLLYYANLGMLTSDLNKLAVFGADNTADNRAAVLNSASNTSLLRGFMGSADSQQKVAAMLDIALKNQKDNLILNTTCKGYYDYDLQKVMIDYSEESPWTDPDMFFSDS